MLNGSANMRIKREIVNKKAIIFVILVVTGGV